MDRTRSTRTEPVIPARPGTERKAATFPIMRTALFLFILCGGLGGRSLAQLGHAPRTFTHADTLRGSIGPGRVWWNVEHYAVSVTPDFLSRSILGITEITFRTTGPGQSMQIDLQQPLVVDSIRLQVKDGGHAGPRPVRAERTDNVVWVYLEEPMGPDENALLTIHYHGTPRTARNAPWDGGWIWKVDAHGNPWMSVACQGLGASVWYPCKDHQSDEPLGATLYITVPDTLVAVGNGRLRTVKNNGNGSSTWTWTVSSPINTYNLVPYIGKYTRLSEQYKGVQGVLDIEHWVLAHNADKALDHFTQVPEMLRCFEEWLGPYPFYEDGYKLVEAPHLGMEHQSAIAYGNGFMNGYRGMDRSGTGHGLEWDYIIVHESGHEWFGNNISTEDIADMWVHEGFTCYSEVLFTECQQGGRSADEYLIGLRKSIMNDRPMIGPYGVNQEGSVDMYNKGANLIHMIRRMMNDDVKFKAMLVDMNRHFRHSVTTSAAIEEYMCAYSGLDLNSVFDQYLRTARIPVLEWGLKRRKPYLRWTNCVEGFAMPVRILAGGRDLGIREVTTSWSRSEGKVHRRTGLRVDPNWYVDLRHIPSRELDH